MTSCLIVCFVVCTCVSLSLHQSGKSVHDLAAETTQSDSPRTTYLSQTIQRRRVRADSIAQVLEATALVPTPLWRTDDLAATLAHASDTVRTA